MWAPAPCLWRIGGGSSSRALYCSFSPAISISLIFMKTHFPCPLLAWSVLQEAFHSLSVSCTPPPPKHTHTLFLIAPPPPPPYCLGPKPALPCMLASASLILHQPGTGRTEREKEEKERAAFACHRLQTAAWLRLSIGPHEKWGILWGLTSGGRWSVWTGSAMEAAMGTADGDH